MNYTSLLLALPITVKKLAQTSPSPLTTSPRDVVVDSKDNVYVLVKYGLIKITPDGTLTDLRTIERNKAIDDTPLQADHMKQIQKAVDFAVLRNMLGK